MSDIYDFDRSELNAQFYGLGDYAGPDVAVGRKALPEPVIEPPACWLCGKPITGGKGLEYVHRDCFAEVAGEEAAR